MNFCKGNILISTPDTLGDIFSRSVILIIEHDEGGAFGLILNKMDETASREITQRLNFHAEVYDGGPLRDQRSFFLIKGDLSKEGYTKVNDHFSFTENMERVVVDIFLKKIRPEDVKIFAGYSGWHAGQLEEELSRNYWKKAKTNIDFAALNSHDLWKDLMTSLGGEHLIWANTPKDTRMNETAPRPAVLFLPFFLFDGFQELLKLIGEVELRAYGIKNRILVKHPLGNFIRDFAVVAVKIILAPLFAVIVRHEPVIVRLNCLPFLQNFFSFGKNSFYFH